MYDQEADEDLVGFRQTSDGIEVAPIVHGSRDMRNL